MKGFWNRVQDDPVHYALRIILAITALALVLTALMCSTRAHADVLAMADRDGVTLMLTNELCHIPAIALKYPAKVRRVESGALSVGCYDIRNGSIVVAHFPPGQFLMWSKEFFTITKGM
jgi:hypothetical protein